MGGQEKKNFNYQEVKQRHNDINKLIKLQI